MYRSWEEEPAYRIWQIVNKQKMRPSVIVCLGGPAEGVGKLMEEERGWQIIVPEHASVANAIGAALARTTLCLDFIADTEQNLYSTNLEGYRASWIKT